MVIDEVLLLSEGCLRKVFGVGIFVLTFVGWVFEVDVLVELVKKALICSRQPIARHSKLDCST